MSTQEIGWKFPPTGGGAADGWNDSGIAHFVSASLASLAREILQNSLDARAGADAPVVVSFGIETIQRSPADGWDQLAASLDACSKEERADEKAMKALETAQGLLRQSTITYLRVSDYNTTGLHGGHWRALVKERGTSVHEQADSGGSHGQGKHAPFVFSDLRTVFYWTRFEEDGSPVERFQGKAILMSHQGAGGETQGTGFFGLTDGCEALQGFEIPQFVRDKEYQDQRGNGTSLWIAGFAGRDGWQRDIAASVIANFFAAIQDGQLKVVLEPDPETDELGLIEIEAETLDQWYDYLLADGRSVDGGERLNDSRTYATILRQKAPDVELVDGDLGLCQMWIQVGEEDSELPSSVALIRRTGMLITDDQQGLKRFRGMRPFGAVCRFIDHDGNTLLRRMEPPRHDQFEPDWIREPSERRHAAAALRRVVEWIRAEIRKAAAPPPPADSVVLEELAHYLPDLEPDDVFDRGDRGKDEQREAAFGGVSNIRLKPRRRATLRPLPDDDSEGGEGDDVGGEGGQGGAGGSGGGDGFGEGEGDATGGTGSRGGEYGGSPVPIVDVRSLAVPGVEHLYRFSFTPQVNASASIRFDEAGDSTAIRRDDLQPVNERGEPIDLRKVDLVAGKRVTIDVVSKGSIIDRAWRVHAVEAAETDGGKKS